MKRMLIVVGLVASFLMLAGCASQCSQCKSCMASAPATHDYKGEVR